MTNLASCSRRAFLATAAAGAAASVFGAVSNAPVAPVQNGPRGGRRGRTTVSIAGDQFLLNGKLTYPGRTYQGHRVEGLLLNARLVQGIFDDLNPDTVARWAYPDTGRWDPERNVREFLAAMPVWRSHGLLAFTLNVQGGSPEGYSKAQPWLTSGYAPDGSARPDFFARLSRILDFADELGMVVILGYFYFGQARHFESERAVLRAVDETTSWLLQNGYRNVLVEIANETSPNGYPFRCLQSQGIHETIQRAQRISVEGRRLLVGTSYPGNRLPSDAVITASDFILLHGNGVREPTRIREMVGTVKSNAAWTAKPILFNEDDHFAFDAPDNNFLAALSAGASWGYFDPGESNYRDGYQCPPVNWTLSSPRKQSFFSRLKEITGV